MKRRYWIPLAAALPTGGLLALHRLRVREERALEALWDALSSPRLQPAAFDPAMVRGLPPPAQRYLLRALAPGTPLRRVLRCTMRGTLQLDPARAPQPMTAEELLAPPHGFIWKAQVGSSRLAVRGFDAYAHGEGRMRWWLLGLVPLVRAGGPDVSRSAAGRLGGEAVLVPPALLPEAGARWTAVDDASARVRLDIGGEPVTLTLTVDAEGRLARVSLLRWREAAAGRAAGYARFDVDGWAGEQTFDGITIPTRFRAGWDLGTPGATPFFHATLTDAAFL